MLEVQEFSRLFLTIEYPFEIVQVKKNNNPDEAYIDIDVSKDYHPFEELPYIATYYVTMCLKKKKLCSFTNYYFEDKIIFFKFSFY